MSRRFILEECGLSKRTLRTLMTLRSVIEDVEEYEEFAKWRTCELAEQSIYSATSGPK